MTANCQKSVHWENNTIEICKKRFRDEESKLTREKSSKNPRLIEYEIRTFDDMEISSDSDSDMELLDDLSSSNYPPITSFFEISYFGLIGTHITTKIFNYLPAKDLESIGCANDEFRLKFIEPIFEERCKAKKPTEIKCLGDSWKSFYNYLLRKIDLSKRHGDFPDSFRARLNISQLRDICGDDFGFAMEFLDISMTEIRKSFSLLKHGICEKDLRMVSLHAHDIKGAGSNNGFEGIYAVGKKMDELKFSYSYPWSDCTALLSILEDEIKIAENICIDILTSYNSDFLSWDSLMHLNTTRLRN